MAAEKVTTMVLRVNLSCPSCYKKTKKTLNKFPEVRDQIYDEKANTVTITVFCCSPENIRDKLCSKGGKTIKSIEIKESKELEKEKEPEKTNEKAKGKEKLKEEGNSKQVENSKCIRYWNQLKSSKKDVEKPQMENSKSSEEAGDKPISSRGPPAENPTENPNQVLQAESHKYHVNPSPVHTVECPEPRADGVPSIFPYVGPGYSSYAVGPSYHGYGYTPEPNQCYEGYYGHGYGYGNGSYGNGEADGNRSDNYSSEENPQACCII